MTRDEIITKVKTLNFPKDSYVVYGSCPLAALAIRESGDVDLLVSSEIYEKLRHAGWKQIHKGPDDDPLVYDVFEAHNSWNFSPYKPTLEELLKRSMEIDGIPFASLDDVLKWKTASGRPKDLSDIVLIKEYLSRQ